MNVRRAVEQDAAGISRLAARTFAMACPPDLPAADIAAHIATELHERRFADLMLQAQFFVIDDGDEIGGYLMVVDGFPPIENDWRNPLEVRRIYVDEHLQGSGAASALMQVAIDIAEQSDCDRLWLGTNQANTRAIAFYRKHGFEIVGERTFRVGETEASDYVLARPGHTVGE